MIEKNEEVLLPNTNLEIHNESDSAMYEVRLGLNIPSPSTPGC